MLKLEFLQYQYLGNTLENYLYSVVIFIGFVVFGYLAKRIVISKFKALAERTETKIDDLLIKIWERGAVFFAFIAGLYFALEFLEFQAEVQELVDTAILLVLTFKVARLVQFLFDSILTIYLRPLADHSQAIDDQFVIFFKKLGNVIIWVLAILFVIANMGVNITSLITGLGIGGLALALGAQESISNIFAAVTLLADRPFKTGDWMLIEGREGNIRELGLRSIKMTTFDGTEVIIPTKKAASAVIENVDRRHAVKISTDIAVDNQVAHKKLDKALQDIRDFFEGWDEEIARHRVNVFDYQNRAINLQIQYWVKETHDWDHVLSVRTDVNLKMKEIFDKRGVKLARGINVEMDSN